MRKLSATGQKRRDDRKKILDEISKYSYEFVCEFQKIFPPITIHYKPGTVEGGKWGKYNYYSQNIIGLFNKKASAFGSVNLTILYDNGYDDFISRWNAFKNMKGINENTI